jgi:Domain of unknown function (DUF4159)
MLIRCALVAGLLLTLALGSMSSAQDIGALFGVMDNKNTTDGYEFVFARLQYGSNSYGRGNGAWSTDYPNADYKFMLGIERLTNIRIRLPRSLYASEDYVYVPPSDDRIYDYPLLYAVEVGNWYLDDKDAAMLREYVERGGFLVVDDFWGTRQFADFNGQLAKIFPDREVEDIPLDHPVFHSFYDIDELVQVPNISNARRGGPTWEQDLRDPYALAIFDDDRRPMVMINFNTDLGDAWEWADDPTYPHFYSGFAYRMGINFIVYAMTH